MHFFKILFQVTHRPSFLGRQSLENYCVPFAVSFFLLFHFSDGSALISVHLRELLPLLDFSLASVGKTFARREL